jgi:hypothetical protein
MIAYLLFKLSEESNKTLVPLEFILQVYSVQTVELVVSKIKAEL